MQVSTATPRLANGNPGIVPSFMAAPACSDSHAQAPVRPQPVERSAQPGEQQAVESALRDIRDFWTGLGVGAAEGNDRNLDVQFMARYPNASYSRGGGSEVMKIGNDAESGRSYAFSKDVIAHEYAHRIVRHILNMEMLGESGAVNESLADTFAAAVDASNWTIGEDSHPGGIRDMARPDRPEDTIRLSGGRRITMPATMEDYVDTTIDRGGVHINVGIPNKAAAYIGQRLGREAMAQIYLGAIRNHMSRDGGIADLASATVESSRDVFGAGSRQVQTVIDAWRAVGIDEAGDAVRAAASLDVGHAG